MIQKMFYKEDEIISNKIKLLVKVFFFFNTEAKIIYCQYFKSFSNDVLHYFLKYKCTGVYV